MAATLQEKWTAHLDAGFRQRVLVALCTAAVANVGEAAGSVGSDKRTAFARAVLADPASFLDRVALVVVDDGTDQASTDAQIAARVGNLWNAFAGVRGGE